MVSIVKRKIFKLYYNIHKAYCYLMLFNILKSNICLCVEDINIIFVSTLSSVPPLPHMKIIVINCPFKYNMKSSDRCPGKP